LPSFDAGKTVLTQVGGIISEIVGYIHVTLTAPLSGVARFLALGRVTKGCGVQWVHVRIQARIALASVEAFT